MVGIHTSQAIPSGDVQINVRRFGVSRSSGKAPILFIHGLSYFSYDWVDFGRALCTDREGAAMDMRGFGDSSESRARDYTVNTMASDIGNVLVGLGWPQAILVAHSMGGRSASCFTADNPNRVKALVLVDWSPENAPEGSKRVATTVANTPDFFTSIDAAINYFGGDSGSTTTRQRYEAYMEPVPGGYRIKRDDFFRQQFRRQIATGEKTSHGVDLWDVLSRVAVPCLVVRGSHSDLFAAATVPKVRQANKSIQVQEIDAGHDVAGDNPKAALAAIRQFINTQEN